MVAGFFWRRPQLVALSAILTWWSSFIFSWEALAMRPSAPNWLFSGEQTAEWARVCAAVRNQVDPEIDGARAVERANGNFDDWRSGPRGLSTRANEFATELRQRNDHRVLNGLATDRQDGEEVIDRVQYLAQKSVPELRRMGFDRPDEVKTVLMECFGVMDAARRRPEIAAPAVFDADAAAPPKAEPHPAAPNAKRQRCSGPAGAAAEAADPRHPGAVAADHGRTKEDMRTNEIVRNAEEYLMRHVAWANRSERTESVRLADFSGIFDEPRYHEQRNEQDSLRRIMLNPPEEDSVFSDEVLPGLYLGSFTNLHLGLRQIASRRWNADMGLPGTVRWESIHPDVNFVVAAVNFALHSPVLNSAGHGRYLRRQLELRQQADQGRTERKLAADVLDSVKEARDAYNAHVAARRVAGPGGGTPAPTDLTGEQWELFRRWGAGPGKGNAASKATAQANALPQDGCSAIPDLRALEFSGDEYARIEDTKLYQVALTQRTGEERPPDVSEASLNVGDNELLRAIRLVQLVRAAGQRVFVGCAQGMDRSATVMIAYVMLEYDVGFPTAVAFVQAKRRVVGGPSMVGYPAYRQAIRSAMNGAGRTDLANSVPQ